MKKCKSFIERYWSKSFFELSEGERQLFAIIRSLFKKPEILFLDEPTSSLDSSNKKWLYEILVNLKEEMIIFIISHAPEDLKICDNIIDLNKK